MRLHLLRDRSAMLYTEPFVWCSASMAAYGVDVEHSHHASAAFALEATIRTADVYLLENTLCSADLLDRLGRDRVIVYDRVDGAQIEGRQWLPETRGILKGYRLFPTALNNSYCGRYHAHLLKAVGVIGEKSSAYPDPPRPVLTDEQLRRITLCHGFGSFSPIRRLVRLYPTIDFAQPRTYSFHFACRTNFDGYEIGTHRQLGLNGVLRLQWPGLVADQARIPWDSYIDTLRNSRCAISPWGYGEATLRDYEALLCGTILVKPPMDHVVCLPMVYTPGETYIPCRPDFADLSEIVARVDAEWDQWRDRRIRARELALRATNPQEVAAVIVKSIRGLMA